MAGCGAAGYGTARRGSHGKAWQGMVRRGRQGLAGVVWHAGVWHGATRFGKAGEARRVGV
jgi:hypothetical protein